MNSVKKDGKMMVKAEKLQYLQKWELANMEMLEDVGLGKDCSADNTAAPYVAFSSIRSKVYSAVTADGIPG